MVALRSFLPLAGTELRGGPARLHEQRICPACARSDDLAGRFVSAESLCRRRQHSDLNRKTMDSLFWPLLNRFSVVMRRIVIEVIFGS